MAVVVLLADGVRPDTLRAAIESGETPALARLRDEGALTTITTCFPSVTGPGYVPFITGRYPGAVGLVGLRWFDRSRIHCRWPGHARSYVGYEFDQLDADLDPSAPTVFDLVPRSVAAFALVNRGLARDAHIGRVSGWAAVRAAVAHFTGGVEAVLAVDRETGSALRARVRDDRPDFAFAAFGAMDKVSHVQGHDAPGVRAALRTVDATAAGIRADAEADGRWDGMHLWVASDHGHAPVHDHDELADVVASLGYRVLAHPRVFVRAPEVAVMVSGNAMAHVYVDLDRRDQPWWPALEARWSRLVDALLARQSVDLVILPTVDGAVIRSPRGDADLRVARGHYSYRRRTGDPLGVGTDLACVSPDDAYAATRHGVYPDALAQIAALAAAPRAGDIILSAAPGWDFRKRFEPVDHRSTHGALHRDQMLVPLLLNRRPAATSAPRRTVDVMPSALAALGLPIPPGLDGRSFVDGAAR